LQQDLIRLQGVTALVEQGADAPDKPSQEMLRWYDTWAHGWAALRHAVERQLQTARPEVAENVRTELQSIERRQVRVANRLGASQILAQELSDLPVVNAPTELWHATLDRPQSVSRYVSPGGVAAIGLGYRRLEPDRFSTGLLGVMGLLTLILAAALLVRQNALARLVSRWPQPVGILVGLSWWWWLAPSILGLAIAAVCLAGWLRSAWRRRSRPHATIVPMGTRN